ncbi:MAG: 2-iminoacetate synthase ThiH [Oscillospiraceae bacterium]|nr:2-iminoacetate synthase ThiH [Oscillospiraceae bacterium]
MKQTAFDPMSYLPGMERLDSGVMRRVLDAVKGYAPEDFAEDDARRALERDTKGPWELAALLSPGAAPLLEDMAAAARRETRRWFGNGVGLFTPLYIANYCENACSYCGFGSGHRIRRGKLSREDILREAEAIASTGLREILVLTGECRGAAGVEYIGGALALLRAYFSVIGVEIFPLNTEEYRYLRDCGADYVSVYQETYDPARYDEVHPLGPKRSYPYRFDAQERALRGGMRGVAFGSLLGLGDFRADAYAAGLHAYFLQQKYPHAEIAFSFPRLRPFGSDPAPASRILSPLKESDLLQVMLAYRLFLPFAGITLSTRERPGFRDRAAALVATKLSAGVSVGVGGHGEKAKGDPQFQIADGRSVDEVRAMLLEQGMQPVFMDYVRV